MVFLEALQRLSHYLVSRSIPPLLLLPPAWVEVPYVAQPSIMVGLTLQSKTLVTLELETQMVHRHLSLVH